MCTVYRASCIIVYSVLCSVHYSPCELVSPTHTPILTSSLQLPIRHSGTKSLTPRPLECANLKLLASAQCSGRSERRHPVVWKVKHTQPSNPDPRATRSASQTQLPFCATSGEENENGAVDDGYSAQ